VRSFQLAHTVSLGAKHQRAYPISGNIINGDVLHDAIAQGSCADVLEESRTDKPL
jgi:hypothetical protein